MKKSFILFTLLLSSAISTTAFAMLVRPIQAALYSRAISTSSQLYKKDKGVPKKTKRAPIYHYLKQEKEIVSKRLDDLAEETGARIEREIANLPEILVMLTAQGIMIEATKQAAPFIMRKTILDKIINCMEDQTVAKFSEKRKVEYCLQATDDFMQKIFADNSRSEDAALAKREFDYLKGQIRLLE